MFRRVLQSAYSNKKQLSLVTIAVSASVASVGVITCDESEASKVKLWLWGDNKTNNVRYSKNDYYHKPRANTFFDKSLRSVAFGPGLSVGVDKDGNVYGWGKAFGKDVTSSRTPKLLLEGANIVEVSDLHLVMLTIKV